MRRFFLAIVAVLLALPISAGARSPVIVAEDVLTGSSSSSSVDAATPSANTMYLFLVNLTSHNMPSSSVTANIVFTNAVGNRVTITLVNGGGSGDNTSSNMAPVYAKGGTTVTITTVFTGAGGTYDLDAVLVEQ